MNTPDWQTQKLIDEMFERVGLAGDDVEPDCFSNEQIIEFVRNISVLASLLGSLPNDASVSERRRLLTRRLKNMASVAQA